MGDHQYKIEVELDFAELPETADAEFVHEPAPGPEKKVWTIGEDIRFGPAGDCTMLAGAKFTLLRDGRFVWEANVRSGDTNDKWLSSFEMRRTRDGAHLWVHSWIGKEMPEAGKLYPWRFDAGTSAVRAQFFDDSNFFSHGYRC